MEAVDYVRNTKMDTVYGTKKYFQSLSGASDIYRTQACRAVSNDYTYQNTLGRRSTLGAYYHMNKQPSFTNEHSLNSQYGYNAWGIWRDGRNIAPSTFSAKTHTHYQKPRSFSIILTTAVFIVLLAVISIAGLAFYFSSVKGNLDDTVLGFEGSFRIAKGDLFSTGLKYNHTTTYKQKIEFYKRFIERSLMDNGLQPLRVDTWGFGEGPLIEVSFRTFLDVKKLPQTIHNVEDYIKESLFMETTAAKSLYRSLRIDTESVEIKRILDESIVRSASLFKDTNQPPTSQSQLEKRLLKKPNTPTLLSKPATSVKPRNTHRPHSPDDEPDIDVENAPVIQGSFEGSFEITKTDADIARKKVTPTRAYTSLAPKAVTPFALRVKPKKPANEKLTTIIPQPQSPTTTSAATSTTTNKATSTTSKTVGITTSTLPKTTTTTNTTTTTTTPKTTTSTSSASSSSSSTNLSTSTSTDSSSPATTTTTTTKSTPSATMPSILNAPTTIQQLAFQPSTPFAPKQPFSLPSASTPSVGLLLPKLDANLFTSVPVLDTQPWRPIHREVSELLPGPPPAFPTKTLSDIEKPLPVAPVFRSPDMPMRRIDEMELPFISENPSPPTPSAYNPYAPGFYGTAIRKPDLSAEVSAIPEDMVFYHSFGNPVFMPGVEDIERLGAGAHVKPHPLPVPLIDEVIVPEFKPLIPNVEQISIEDEKKFEHLGGGVIVKKHGLELAKGEEKSKTGAGIQASNSESESEIEAELASSTQKSTTTASVKSTTFRPKVSTPNINRIESSANSELADTIGEFFVKLLNLPIENGRNVTKLENQPIESRVEPEEQTSDETATEVESKAQEEHEDGEEQIFGEHKENEQFVFKEGNENLDDTKPELRQTVENPVSEVVEDVTTTAKPTFLNIKELILKRNEAKNQTRNIENNITGRPTPPTTTPTPTTSTTTSMNTQPSATDNANKSGPTKWQRIRPTYNQKPTTILDDSNLFPSQSKWEFVNNTSTNGFGHTGNMRKVFNKTLQAWISEDVSSGNTGDNFTLNDIKTRINNATNIQDISLIFDTLASKLGITPHVPTKVPPFSQNKLNKHPSVLSAANEKSKIKLPNTNLVNKAIITTTKAAPNSTLQPNEIRDKPSTASIQWLATTRRGTITAVPASATKTPWLTMTSTKRITTPTPTPIMSPTTIAPTPTPARRTTMGAQSSLPRVTPQVEQKQPLTLPVATTSADEQQQKQEKEHFIELPLERRDSIVIPSFIKPMSTFMEDNPSSEGIGAAIPVVGEAEVEVIDPTKYEEMLKSSQFAIEMTTETAPQLVTLLPVRSNSGIRTYRPTTQNDNDDDTNLAARSNDQLSLPVAESVSRFIDGAVEGRTGQVEVVPEPLKEAILREVGSSIESTTTTTNASTTTPSTTITNPKEVITAAARRRVGSGAASASGIRRKSDINQARRFPPAEAVVKGGLRVKVK